MVGIRGNGEGTLIRRLAVASKRLLLGLGVGPEERKCSKLRTWGWMDTESLPRVLHKGSDSTRAARRFIVHSISCCLILCFSEKEAASGT